MNAFVYQYPVKNYFGEGAVEQALAAELPSMGDTVMLAYGGGSVKRTGVYDRVRTALEAAGKRVVDFAGIMPNPTYAKVQEGAALARAEHVNFILAVGGGSVFDCCKIVSAQALLDEDIHEYEHVAGKVPTALIPMGCIVTLSGTGAEQNNGGVITIEDAHWKGPFAGALPRWAALDPALTLTVPHLQFMSGAYDSLSHCMETYFGTPREGCASDDINLAVQRNIIRNMRVVNETQGDGADGASESADGDADLAEGAVGRADCVRGDGGRAEGVARRADDDAERAEGAVGCTDCAGGDAGRADAGAGRVERNLAARSELVYDSAMGENGVLKIGKVGDFQAHMIQHQYGAYTHTNHGLGLAVIHPALYRHLAPEAPAQFARWAREVWGVTEADDLAAALAGIDALEAFTREMGLPTSFAELGGDASDETLRAVADTALLMPACAKHLERDEIFQILTECR